MKFRTRLVTVLTTTTTLTYAAAFGGVWVVVNHSETQELDRALRSAALEEARTLSSLAPDAPGPPVLGMHPGPFGDDAMLLERYIALFVDGNRVPVVAPRGKSCPDPPDLSVSEPFNARCRVSVRAIVVNVPDRPGMRLFVGLPRTNLDADARFLQQTLAVALLMAIGTATLVRTVLIRRLTRQHEAIAQTTHRVADGDLTARVDILSRDEDLLQLTHDVNHMISRVATLVESQRRFISHAAHELRTPFTALYGELQLAARKERTNEEYRAAIHEALDAAGRLKILTEELLALARLGTQARAPDADVRLDEIVRDAATQVERESIARGATIEVDAPPLEVRGRRGELVRLVRNLLENAVAHSDQGSSVKVTVREAGSKNVEVVVADEGPGVPEADRERIFEPFYRSADDRGREGPGAGLGLAIALEIARTHAGDLRLEPPAKSGQGPRPGAVFVARLPRAPAAGSA